METAVGFLEHVSGYTQDIVYDLLFTENRVIALIVEHPADVPYRVSATELLIGSQLGKHGERTDRKKIAAERRRVHRQMPIDQLVAMDNRNFDIPLDTVTAVEIKRGLWRSHLKFTIVRPDAREVAIRFTFQKRSVPLAENLIERVLPGKVRKSP
jgi:hypothetical protein